MKVKTNKYGVGYIVARNEIFDFIDFIYIMIMIILILNYLFMVMFVCSNLDVFGLHVHQLIKQKIYG